jgi:hypothetical protein
MTDISTRALDRELKRGSAELLILSLLDARPLLRQPAHATTTVLTLALAIGADSAIFGAVYGVLLTPSAIRQPDNLVICWERDTSRSPVVELSYRNFQDWVCRFPTRKEEAVPSRHERREAASRVPAGRCGCPKRQVRLKPDP